MEASELIDLRRIYAGRSIHCHRIRVWEQDGHSIRFAARGNSCNVDGGRIHINISRAFPVTTATVASTCESDNQTRTRTRIPNGEKEARPLNLSVRRLQPSVSMNHDAVNKAGKTGIVNDGTSCVTNGRDR